VCDKHPAKKHDIPWVHKPADSTICMHCLSLVKLLCYTDLSQKEERLGRCLLKAPCSPPEQCTVRNWSHYVFWGEKWGKEGWHHALRTCRKPLPGKNITSESSGQSKSSAFCFTVKKPFVCSPSTPGILCVDSTVTPLSKKEAISTSLYCIYN